MDFYKQIFKRKSFHIFKNIEVITDDELGRLNDFFKAAKPLNAEIKTEIHIVPEEQTTCKRGGQYCILFYSETKEEYLRNIGYIGEQIDLYLASQNIGALWFGIGKPKDMQINGLDFVIMISIAKIPEDKFRKDMFKSKRKPLCEIWNGDTLGVAEIARFAPSACNTQPWFTENNGSDLMIYRYKKPGKRGIMPIDKVMYYNRIDMGIFLFMLETCLEHENYTYERSLFEDISDHSIEQTLIARYTYRSNQANSNSVRFNNPTSPFCRTSFRCNKAIGEHMEAGTARKFQFGTPELIKSFKNMDKEFYLVLQSEKQ